MIDPRARADTTNLAAARLGRRKIYIDIHPDDAELARGRLAREAAVAGKGGKDAPGAPRGSSASRRPGHGEALVGQDVFAGRAMCARSVTSLGPLSTPTRAGLGMEGWSVAG